jgi:hypothetical protein
MTLWESVISPSEREGTVETAGCRTTITYKKRPLFDTHAYTCVYERKDSTNPDRITGSTALVWRPKAGFALWLRSTRCSDRPSRLQRRGPKRVVTHTSILDHRASAFATLATVTTLQLLHVLTHFPQTDVVVRPFWELRRCSHCS